MDSNGVNFHATGRDGEWDKRLGLVTRLQINWLRIIFFWFKEARNSFFGLGVYLLKSKFRIEDKLRFPWYYTTSSTYDQSLFSHWFPSNSCHHSNGNGQPSFWIMSNISKTSQTLCEETWTIWTTQPTQLVCEIREKSVRAFSCKSWIIFYGLILVIPAIFFNISRKIKPNTFSFQKCLFSLKLAGTSKRIIILTSINLREKSVSAV